MEKHTGLSSFAHMAEPERMIFIAQLNHLMWYNEGCFEEAKKLVDEWKTKNTKTAVFYPKIES